MVSAIQGYIQYFKYVPLSWRYMTNYFFTWHVLLTRQSRSGWLAGEHEEGSSFYKHISRGSFVKLINALKASRIEFSMQCYRFFVVFFHADMKNTGGR